jgi:hypothetical protein
VNYATNTRLEDRLAPDEPPYRSRGEAQVGRLLDRYGIPFFYELPTLIYDRGRHSVWHPDFMLPTYNGLIVEYAGMPERFDYAAGIHHKRIVYETNGLPALFIYPHDLEGPAWPDDVYARIIAAGRSALSPGVASIRLRPATSATQRAVPHPDRAAPGYAGTR